jgi:hypothetical protein
MKFYLRVINPVIALIVFILCFWAATTPEEKFSIFGIVGGGICSYFFAKGLFTSCSLLILGKILLEIMYHSDKQQDRQCKGTDILYAVSFGVFTIGSLIGIFMLGDFHTFSKKAEKAEEKVIDDPVGLKVTDLYRVKESERLKFAAKVLNTTPWEWKEIYLKSKLSIRGKYSDEEDVRVARLESQKSEDFIIDFDDFYSRNVPDSVSIVFDIKATKERPEEMGK